MHMAEAVANYNGMDDPASGASAQDEERVGQVMRSRAQAALGPVQLCTVLLS